MKLTSETITRQVLKAKSDINTYCATEATTLKTILQENVEQLEASVGASINSTGHKVLMEKKLIVAVSELLGTKESAELKEAQTTKLTLLFTTAI